MLIIHCSGKQLGGAEKSLLLSLLSRFPKENLLFILPATGGLASELQKQKCAYLILRWPCGLNFFTQRQWFWQWPLYPLILFGFLLYAFRLYKKIPAHASLISSGIKSHITLLSLLPILREKLIFDIRDFIRPLGLRRVLSRVIALFGAKVQVNSRLVAKDYTHAEVIYPLIQWQRDPQPQQKKHGNLIVTHLAYYAPYKGQKMFLHAARALLDAGVQAEFWMIGDVIYPGKKYTEYKSELLALRTQLGLEQQVKYWGEIPSPISLISPMDEGNLQATTVQGLLEQTNLLLHCTVEPEPFGRVIMEALSCGAEVICHKASGACENLQVTSEFSTTYSSLRKVLGENYVQIISH